MVEKIKIMLHAVKMQRALAFYELIFGFEPGYTSEHWSELCFGDAIIAFHGGGDGSENRSGLSIQVENIKLVCEAVRRAGGTVTVPPVAREGEPIMLGEFKDREGNIVMLTEFIG